MKRGLTLALLFWAALLVAAPALATKLRRPFNANINLGYGFDHNGSAAGCKDYGCGTKCYNGHRGNDYPLPFGTTVVAAAKGTVEYVNQGCANVGSLTNTCGGGFGNYVRIAHSDGKRTYYAHLRNGSVTVSVGQSVSCGQKIGESASSGRSSGNHLHFEVRNSNVSRDPYSGSCGPSSSYWVSQGSYSTTPGTGCEVTCACTSGQKQSEACGNCGTRTRTCNSSCQWGSWSSCSGQGVCAAGKKESQQCGDCGTRSRTCSSSCKWGSFGSCAGPDPEGGQQSCSTGLLGACAEGRMRCEAGGKLACRGLTEAKEETCSGVDDDCDGVIDNGTPAEMGATPPEWAAELVSVSHGLSVAKGAKTKVTVEFKNVGTQAWAAGEPALVALQAPPGDASGLSVDSWAETVASPKSETPVGEVARFEFSAGIAGDATEAEGSFGLTTPSGEPLACPSPIAEVNLRLQGAPVSDGGADAGVEPTSAEHREQLVPLDSGCACRAASPSPSNSAPFALLGLGLAFLLRRSRRALTP